MHTATHLVVPYLLVLSSQLDIAVYECEPRAHREAKDYIDELISEWQSKHWDDEHSQMHLDGSGSMFHACQKNCLPSHGGTYAGTPEAICIYGTGG